MKRIVFFVVVFLLFFLFFFGWQLVKYSDHNLHVIFCDVGQGDGALIRTPEGVDMLIDGGPDGSIDQCLSRHMPFWNRQVEVMLLTHHHLDHYGGFLDVAKQYGVKYFVQPDVAADAPAWKQLLTELTSDKASMKTAQIGDVIHLKDVQFSVLNPYDAKMESKMDVNDESIVGVLRYKDFTVLFTGDALAAASDTFDAQIPHVNILKVPHHGSRNGLTAAMLSAAHPQLAVISSGKGNKFGHPHKETLELLSGTKTMRTDMVGSIEIVSDGKSWWVKK